MKPLKETIVERKKPASKISNERQELLATILAVINAERAGTVYKPMTGRGIAMKLAHVKTVGVCEIGSTELFPCQRKQGNWSRIY